MNLVVNNHNVLLIVFVTFLCSFLFTYLAKVIAKHVNAIDIPNERKVHTKPTPRLGGLSIYVAFLMGYILYGTVNTQMISILIGSFILVILGIIDDINSIKARYKFLVQLVAASIVVIYGQIYFNEISILGLHLVFSKPIGYLFSILFIAAIANAINFIDGLDGLASGISSIYFLTIGIIAFLLNRIGGLDIILAFIMLGSTLGFLVHNFPPAKIFMGDTGSLFLGFMIAVVSLLGFKGATLTSLIIPILVLAVPIFDTVFAIFRRLIKHQNIAVADKEHFHHQLLKLKFNPQASILIIYAIDIMFCAVSIFYVIGEAEVAIGIYVILMLVLLFIVMKTDILFEHKKGVVHDRKKK